MSDFFLRQIDHLNLRRYYYSVILILIILIAYFPVLSGEFALKNDIVQLDLPVKYFISKEIHRGDLPLWFYNWGAGFPLGHVFSWSIYNPVTLFFCTIFNYDLQTLHLEFLFYIILGALGVEKICKSLLNLAGSSCLIASVVYALSGITLSCSQFLAYIAAIAMLPWCFYFLLKLLRESTLYNTLSFSLSFFLLISWSYPAASIICSYSILCLIIICHFSFESCKLNKRKVIFLALSGLVILLLSLPLIYITYKTLPLFTRSHELINYTNDFGYMHVSSFLTFFFPFFNTDLNDPETTFLFQNVFIGTLSLGVVISYIINSKFNGKYRKVGIYLVLSALVALIIACGKAMGLKVLLDEILPGLKWFRFPSFFRIFFLIPICILIGICIDNTTGKYSIGMMQRRAILLILIATNSIIIIKLLVDPNSQLDTFYPILNMPKEYILTLACFLWNLCLISIFLFISKAVRYIRFLIILDMLVMALLALPIYSISRYSVYEVSQILGLGSDTFKKEILIDNSVSSYTDSQSNTFNSINVYRNSISAANQYLGPLYLKSFDTLANSKYSKTEPGKVIFIDNDLQDSTRVRMINNTFENRTFSASLQLNKELRINLFQMWHPFWKAYIDGSPVPVLKSEEGIVYVNANQGKHHIEFVIEDIYVKMFTFLYFFLLILIFVYIFGVKLKVFNV